MEDFKIGDDFSESDTEYIQLEGHRSFRFSQRNIRYNKGPGKLYDTALPNSIMQEVKMKNHGLITGATISNDGRYYICGGRKMISIYDLDSYKCKDEFGTPTLHKLISLRDIYHHLTCIDYNANLNKILVCTLNEKIQLHSIDPEVSDYDIIRIKDTPYCGMFLLDDITSKCGVFDVKFSELNGSKFLVTCNNDFMLCDVETQKVVERIENTHFDEINSLMIKPGKSCQNLIVTGSDDAIINVYDKRLIGSEGGCQPVGKFFGHNSGITSVDITNCGRYIASNGKDQCVKLWDIRKMLPPSKYEKAKRRCIVYDYRLTKFDTSKAFIHENDNSLFTFTGHTTHLTQISCSFSPQSWTGERFIACGSFCGCTNIYDTQSGEKVSNLKPNTKNITKIPLWHPKQRKLISTSENKFHVFCYDSKKSSLFECMSKKENLDKRIIKNYKKFQKQHKKSSNNDKLSLSKVH